MANYYNAVIPRPEGIPATVEVRIFAGRIDGGNLTAEELAALRAVYPRAEGGDAVEVPSRPVRKTKTGTKARKPSTKRAAAKR